MANLPDPSGIQSLSAALRARGISSRELVAEALRKVAQLDATLNAFITVTGDAAKLHADLLDRELAEGKDRGPLHGIPIAHKDLVRTSGVRTTGGSRIFANYIPTRDAAVAQQLTEAGAVSIGKTGLHELAYGVTSNNPHYGAIHNPWDLARIPGGSSGGSAVAVSAGIVPFATGTDTGGSIRVPASFCGIVGFKPTFGKINTAGVLPLGVTLDHIGPMTRTVRDAAIAYRSMLTAERAAEVGIPFEKIEMRGVRIGLPRNYYFERVDPETAESVKSAIEKAAQLGARIVEIEVPDMVELTRAGATCLLAEAASSLRPYLDRRADFGEDVLERLDQGRAILAIDYLEALRVRRRTARAFAKLWQHIDFLFTPSTPMTAPLIGQKFVEFGSAGFQGETEETRAAATRFTRGMNALGLPSISIPCGLSKSGLPIGLQIIGARDRDNSVLQAAADMEHVLGFAGKPPIAA